MNNDSSIIKLRCQIKLLAHPTHLLGSKSAAFFISMRAFVAFPILSWNQRIIMDKNKLRFQTEEI